MIGSILAKIGLPILVKAVKGGLSSMDNGVAKTAVSVLDEVDRAIEDKKISQEQIVEANRHTEKMQELAVDREKEFIKVINQTMQVETRSEDKYVRRWRPTFGYAVALAWTLIMTSLAYAIIMTPTKAPAIIAALVNTSPIWGVALAVLGVSVVKRSQDKTL